MESQGKIFCSKFKGVFDHSPVGLDRKQVLALLFFNMTSSIGISRKNGLNKMVSNDNGIWIIGGC